MDIDWSALEYDVIDEKYYRCVDHSVELFTMGWTDWWCVICFMEDSNE